MSVNSKGIGINTDIAAESGGEFGLMPTLSVCWSTAWP